jgi:hypothetical protein
MTTNAFFITGRSLRQEGAGRSVALTIKGCRLSCVGTLVHASCLAQQPAMRGCQAGSQPSTQT